MPKKLYFNRVLTIVSWKINEFEEPLKQLRKIRRDLNFVLKCQKKPYLKTCKSRSIEPEQLNLIQAYLLNSPPPKTWVHWSISAELEEFLRVTKTAQLNAIIEGNTLPILDIDYDVIQMHLIAERLARYLLEQKKPKVDRLNQVSWWYYVLIFLMIIIRLVLYRIPRIYVDKSSR